MKEQLMPDEVLHCRKICVVYGLGGMGKTQIAIEYARLHKTMYSSFFWLDGKTEESLIQSLLLIASRFPKGQIAGEDAQEIKGLEESRKRAQEVLGWFALKENTQWLSTRHPTKKKRLIRIPSLLRLTTLRSTFQEVTRVLLSSLRAFNALDLSEVRSIYASLMFSIAFCF
jgi:hypothetical protein